MKSRKKSDNCAKKSVPTERRICKGSEVGKDEIVGGVGLSGETEEQEVVGGTF